MISTVMQLLERWLKENRLAVVAYFSSQPWPQIDWIFWLRQQLSRIECPTSSADKESVVFCAGIVFIAVRLPHIRTVIEWLLLLLLSWGCISSATTDWLFNMVVSQRYDFPPEGDDYDTSAKVIIIGRGLLWFTQRPSFRCRCFLTLDVSYFGYALLQCIRL